MQSCPKNAHTGTGPTKAKGPVSANALNIAETIPKTASAACKIENILATIKPESREKGALEASPHDLYPKHLDIPELTPSPARGSTGLQIPATVQHEAVQPIDSDSHSLGQRKQPRVGKSMERERQQQQHITMTCLDAHPPTIEMPQFKQEFAVKREGEVKQEKDCEEIDTSYRNINPIENVKLERPETEREATSTPAAPKPGEDSAREAVTVNLINESGDECIDYSTKRRLNDSCSSGNEDVIELSDNSTVDPPGTLKRRKLLEKPVFTPKKSPPNSYKSLIKQSTPSASTATFPPATTSKSKLISSSINRAGNKSAVKRRSILKSKTTLKKMRLAVKAKKKATGKKKTVDESEKSLSNGEDAVDSQATLAVVEENSSEATEKSDEAGNSTEVEHNEEKSMDGSSEYSGKSNIDLTIDRVAKGYFSESDIFTCLSKHRKTTKSQKKFKTKLEKAKKKKSKTLDVPAPEKGKKKPKKEAEVETKVVKGRKTKADELPKKKKTKKQKEAEAAVEKDPLALDEDAPSSQSTPKRKPKTPKNAVEKKSAKKSKVTEAAAEKPVEPLAVESDEDVSETVATIETRDEETSTTVLSSAQTVNTSKSLLDETDVANNNNECFEDNNRHKQQAESLTLYKTPGYGWTTFNKTGGKRGKKGAKFGNRKKHKFTLLNDIVIPKSTSIPRWSNGWVWEGEPYQALVFLNVSVLSSLEYPLKVIAMTPFPPSFSIYNRFYCAICRAMIRQCQGHATTRCVTRTAATSSGHGTACFSARAGSATSCHTSPRWPSCGKIPKTVSQSEVSYRRRF